MSRMGVGDLGLVIGAWIQDVVGSKISEHQDLMCASPDRTLFLTVEVREVDRDRWYAATEELIATIRHLQEEERSASRHLRPPYTGAWFWRIRYLRRNRALRRSFDATSAELRAAFDAAVARYKEQTQDLEDQVQKARQREAAWWRKHNEEIDRRLAEERRKEAKFWRGRLGRGDSGRTSGPSSTYGSDGGGSGFAGGSF